MNLSKLLLPVSVLLGGCWVEQIDAIIDKYDTFGSTGSTGASSSSSSTSTTGTETGFGDGTAAAGTSSGTASSTGDKIDETTTTGIQTTGSQTTGTSVCGDGVVEGDEECDDQNDSPADGCLANCTREWLVFITSKPSTQGDIKGLIGADYQCRHRAAKLFLPNAERYRAWISTSTVHAADRLYHARGPYKLVNGLQVAANWDALIAGPLENPINVSELSETVNGLVFTGTAPSGFAAPNTTHCGDWTKTNEGGLNFAWYGASTEVNGDWTMAVEVDCGAHAGLYCFEQP
ncbi:MAG: DUF4215 domain-containing protein [Nannocystis sp.]|nr:DUF4215 domain-containing protein [Nannocystis sp.]MBA3550528.1 DUF4215 domain-containing protein [Nannocystis sp.]